MSVSYNPWNVFIHFRATALTFKAWPFDPWLSTLNGTHTKINKIAQIVHIFSSVERKTKEKQF